MTKTTAQLAIKVMRLPGWLDANEEPDSEDAAFIVDTYTSMHAAWRVREIAYWPIESIPDEIFEDIVRIIADAVAPAFGDAAPTEIDIETGAPVSMGKKGWNGLKRLKAVQPSGLPVRTQYF